MSKLKILLVQRDPYITNKISEYLTNKGFIVQCESHGDKAVYRILHEEYSLVILDISLPTLNGLEICKLIRPNYSGLIIILTTRKSTEDHINSLEYGAQDFINMPIELPILLARINALLRRFKSKDNYKNEIRFGKLTIDLMKRIVHLHKTVVDLKPSEFDLFILLATNPGKVMSRNVIMQILRGIDYDGIDRSIDLRISYLRNKFFDDLKKPYRIITVRNLGYMFQPNAWN